jgi:hypothetical protein
MPEPLGHSKNVDISIFCLDSKWPRATMAHGSREDEFPIEVWTHDVLERRFVEYLRKVIELSSVKQVTSRGIESCPTISAILN